MGYLYFGTGCRRDHITRLPSWLYPVVTYHFRDRGRAIGQMCLSVRFFALTCERNDLRTGYLVCEFTLILILHRIISRSLSRSGSVVKVYNQQRKKLSLFWPRIRVLCGKVVGATSSKDFLVIMCIWAVCTLRIISITISISDCWRRCQAYSSVCIRQPQGTFLMKMLIDFLGKKIFNCKTRSKLVIN